MKSFPKAIWILLAAIVLVWAGWRLVGTKSAVDLPESREYQATEPDQQVVKVADGMGLITRIKLTPDHQLMLVANLMGDLFVLTKTNGDWVKQSELVYHVEHKMNVAGENGMTGLIVSSDFSHNHFIFLTYTQRQGGGRGENTVLRLKLDQQDGRYVGVDPTIIFKGNTTVLGAHQIQGGTGVMLNGKPHILFSIGEGYQEQRARDLSYEAGKLMLIQEDGSDPAGVRPYPDQPKIQAIGIRNVYDITLDPKNQDWVYFTENGPNENDNIVHAPILDGRQYDFNWRSESNAGTLLKPLVDGQETPELIIRNWEVTVSPTDIEADGAGRVYFNIFSSSRYSKKEVVVGHLTHDQWEWRVVAERKPSVAGGNLLGLAVAGDTVYFGDMLDGAVYMLMPT